MRSDVGRNSGSPVATSGLARASELALSALNAEVPANVLENLYSQDTEELAKRLRSSAGVDGHLRHLPTAELERVTRAGAAVIAETEHGWLVARTGHGILVTDTGERSVPLTKAAFKRLGLGDHVNALVLEPRLPLAKMSSSHNAENKQPWVRLRAFLSLERRDLWSLVAYAVVLGGLTLAVPIAVQVLVNTIAFGSLMQPLVILSLMLLSVLLFSALLQAVEWYAIELLQRRIFVRIAEDFSRRMLALRYETHDRTDVREMSNRVFEVVTLQKTLGSLLLEGLALSLQTLVGLLLLGFYHPALLAFDVFLVLCLILVILLGSGAVDSATRESAAKYETAAFIQTLANHPALFARRASALFAARRADALVRTYLKHRVTHFRHVLRQLLGGLGLQVVALVGLLGLGGFLVIEGELTLGQLVAAELVVGAVGAGFAKLGKHLEKAYDLLASVDKVGKVVDLPCEPVVPAEIPSAPGALGLQLSQLQVDGGEALNAHIPAGARVHLQPGSPDAAARLLEVLAGLRGQRAGAVTLEGIAAGHVRPVLRERAALVRPAQVIAGTIMDNLRVADPELLQDEAWHVLARVGLRDTVAQLPEGLDTFVFPGGGGLSRTQQTLLGIARALLCEPGLLLIDRALDGLQLDAEASAGLHATLLGPAAPFTVVVVTSDRAVKVHCNDTLFQEEDAR